MKKQMKQLFHIFLVKKTLYHNRKQTDKIVNQVFLSNLNRYTETQSLHFNSKKSPGTADKDTFILTMLQSFPPS